MELSQKKTAGFSILEVAIAAAIFVTAVVGIYGVYAASLRVLQAADASAIATENLQQRVEQLRRTSWPNVTSPTYISSLLATPITATTQNLRTVSESIKISAVTLPFASPAPSPLPAAAATPAPFTVTRNAASTVSVSPATPASMLDLPSVNVVASLTWTDNANRQHTRQCATVISKSALIR